MLTKKLTRVVRSVVGRRMGQREALVVLRVHIPRDIGSMFEIAMAAFRRAGINVPLKPADTRLLGPRFDAVISGVPRRQKRRDSLLNPHIVVVRHDT